MTHPVPSELTKLLSTTALTPREALASAVVSPAELAFVGRALDKEAESLVLAAVPPGEFPVDVTIRFRGRLVRGAPTTRRGTVRALRKATLALILQAVDREDVRDAVLRQLGDILHRAHALSEDAEAQLLREFPEIEDAFASLETLTAKLPRVVSAGSTKATDTRLLFVGRGMR